MLAEVELFSCVYVKHHCKGLVRSLVSFSVPHMHTCTPAQTPSPKVHNTHIHRHTHIHTHTHTHMHTYTHTCTQTHTCTYITPRLLKLCCVMQCYCACGHRGCHGNVSIGFRRISLPVKFV